MNLSNPLFKSSITASIHPITQKEITYVIDMNVLEKYSGGGGYSYRLIHISCWIDHFSVLCSDKCP